LLEELSPRRDHVGCFVSDGTNLVVVAIGRRQ
jgi:hypothetical protein